MYWTINGMVIPMKGKETKLISFLKGKRMWGKMATTDEIEFEIDQSDSSDFDDYIAKNIGPYVAEGSMIATAPTYQVKYRFSDGKFAKAHSVSLGSYFSGEEKEAVKNLPSELVNAVLQMYGTQETNVTQVHEIRVNTPAGPIVAKEGPDEDYPGIIIMNEKEPGQPAAILEYSDSAFGNKKSCMQLRVYDMKDPDDEPVAIYQMSQDLRRTEE